eukprot:Nk52_evm31s914 gene=Nk52_evmTU31s914
MFRSALRTALRAQKQAATAAAVKEGSMFRPITCCSSKAFYSSGSDFGANNFMNGTTGPYVDEMYRSWKNDPSSVHASWDAYFRTGSFQPSPALGAKGASSGDAMSGGPTSAKVIQDHLNVHALIRGYQVRGHNVAKLDPLGILEADLDGSIPAEIQYQSYGFTEADLDREFNVAIGEEMSTGFMGNKSTITLRELIKRLEETYCGTIGVEYMHIQNQKECNWIREKIELEQKFQFSKEDKKTILARLIRADGFETFLASKWSAEKRFGLEGCESLIPGMKSLIDLGADLGVENVVIGMPHRGRLNVLGNVIRKPLENIFGEFTSSLDPDQEGSGDVKYHLGLSHDRTTLSGKKIHISLVANPSHLEAVNPVVNGKVRAEQFYKGDVERNKVLPILLHGDAAFSGQGVVFETFGLSDLPSYTTGGTIHIVVNNQIGFTTDPRFSRSSPYCSDVAKTVNAPIFHVNGDDPEAVVRCCNLAMEWRQKFKRDVVVDIVCYRRHGHNEADQPLFTQPTMYKEIAKHLPTAQLYSKRLIEEGNVSKDEVDLEKKKYLDICENAYDKSKELVSKNSDWLESKWEGFLSKKQFGRIQDTGVPVDTLNSIGKAFSTVPSDFTVHKVIGKILKARAKAVEAGHGIDWATAEAMAFGTLLLEGTHVRLSGQDVERGTFSHRHHVLHDQNSEDVFCQLQNLSPNQAAYSVSNSNLSEYAVLGFELGYSMTSPNSLVLWEAQFGDFANTAQCIIDQFVSSGEEKWLRQSGLVMLLPHGFEGMGPEHSSARLERFLQMANDAENEYPDMEHAVRKQIQMSNWQVLNCTTPANYFHALRRQIHREFRKPLIVMSPKSLLKHRLAVSSVEEMSEGTRFRRVIPEEGEPAKNPENVRKLIFCSGKVYYDLLKEREDRGIKDVAIARVEQLSPFPYDLVLRQSKDYPGAEVAWCQEEPRNQGAWTYVRPRFETAYEKEGTARPVSYVGRDTLAATATGSKAQHTFELKTFLEKAFS